MRVAIKYVVPFVLILCILALLPGTYFVYSHSFTQSYKSVMSFFGSMSAVVIDPLHDVLNFFGIWYDRGPISVPAYVRIDYDSSHFLYVDPVLYSYYAASTTAVLVSFDADRFSGYIQDDLILQYQWLWDMRHNGDCYFFFDDRGNYTCHYRYDKSSNWYILERRDVFTQSYYNDSLSAVKIIMTPLIGSSQNPLSYNGDLTVISVTQGFTFIKGKF